MAPKLDLASITERLSPRAAAPVTPEPASAHARAAVAAILRESAPGSEVEILLIRRAEQPRDPWSGHMAFPGGRHERDDESLLVTAIRETREEVGIDLSAHGTLLARLEDLPAMAKGVATGMLVTPFVFGLRGAHALDFDTREVAEALWTPLDPLARGQGADVYEYRHEGIVHELPCLRLGERVVWGLTHRMLLQLFEALRA